MKKTKCICQLCTCGRHRCPHNRGTIGNTKAATDCLLLSEYQEKYDAAKYQKPREAIRPAKKEPSTPVPMDMTSTYSSTYITHELQKRLRKSRSKQKEKKACRPMATKTTYKTDYTSKNGEKAKSFAPDYQYVDRQAPFTSKTIHNTAFKPYDREEMKRCRPQSIRHNENLGKKDDVKFQCTSTVQDDYKAHENVERTKAIRPKQEQVHNSSKLDDRTMYKDTYCQDKLLVAQPKRPKAKTTVAKPAPFYGETTVMADFKPYTNSKPAKSFKPPVKPVSTKTPFDDRTTCSMAYQAWEVKRPEKPTWAHKKAYESPKITFTKTSSYEDDYRKPTDHERAVCKQHKNELQIDHSEKKAPFCQSTHYQDIYREHDGIRPHSFKVVNGYSPPKEKFQVESTYQSYYKGEYTEPAVICRPQSQSVSSKARGGMTFDTTYKKCYTGERPSSCPVYKLRNSQSKETPSQATIQTNTKDTGYGTMEYIGDEDFVYTATRNGHTFFQEKDKTVTIKVA